MEPLIDTGSTSTTISPAVATALKPRVIGKARVSRPGLGIVWEDTYFVRLKFEGHAGSGHWFNLEVIRSQPSTRVLTSWSAWTCWCGSR